MQDRLASLQTRTPRPVQQAFAAVTSSFWLSLVSLGLLVTATGWVIREGATAGILGIIGASMVAVGGLGYTIYRIKYAT